jgi:lipoate-protein ligase A
MKWRLVDSDLSEPAYTVAADEAMAIARSRELVPNTLHFYRRNKPTVSLGYFQKIQDSIDLEFCKRNNVSIVRRATGGSAIYTDPGHQIYGLAIGEDSAPPGRDASMEKICRAIVLALGELGVDSIFKPVNDVLVNGRKISGSAQMRRWGIVLQHGTIILRNDSEMMLGTIKMDAGKVRERGLEPHNYVTSIEETLGHEPNIDSVKKALLHGFCEVFDVEFERSHFSNFENELIQNLIETKYGTDAWNLKA